MCDKICSKCGCVVRNDDCLCPACGEYLIRVNAHASVAIK